MTLHRSRSPCSSHLTAHQTASTRTGYINVLPRPRFLFDFNIPIPIDSTPMDLDRCASSALCKSGSTKCEVTPPPSVHECEPESPTSKESAHTSPLAKVLKQEHSGVFELQSAVANTLFSASPDILASFVDPMVGTFKAVFKGEKQLVIWRKGNAGFIGIFEHHTSMKVFGFEHLVGFAIGYDGSWRIIVGAGNAFCAPRWPVVWTGPYECFGGVYKMTVDRESMEEAKGERAAKLAEMMLEGRFWEATVDVNAT